MTPGNWIAIAAIVVSQMSALTLAFIKLRDRMVRVETVISGSNGKSLVTRLAALEREHYSHVGHCDICAKATKNA